MDLPDGTQVAAAYAFITSVWSTFAIFGTLLSIVAGVKIGAYVLRVVRSAIPG